MIKTALVAGGNGLIGRALVEKLIENSCFVIVLGKRDFLHPKLNQNQNKNNLKYCRVVDSEDWLNRIEKEISPLCKNDGVFFNLAWKGKNALTDGGLSDQFANISIGCEYVKFAKKLNLKKFVNVGSMEETIVEKLLENENWLTEQWISQHKWYALAKLSARDAMSFESYVNKIDFVNARISSVIDGKLQTNKYIEKTFKMILDGHPFEPAKNWELMNITTVEKIANQLFALGEFGKNKRDYVLGTGYAFKLNTYFQLFEDYIKTRGSIDKDINDEEHILKRLDFDTRQLEEDTGILTVESVTSLFESIAQ